MRHNDDPARPALLAGSASSGAVDVVLPTRRFGLWWLRPTIFGALALVAAGVLGLSAMGVMFWRVPELAPAPLGLWIRDVKTYVQGQDKPSVLILEFASSGDTDSAEFSEALSEGLRSMLSIASEISVVQPPMTESANSETATMRELAGRTGARYVLAGHLFKRGDDFVVSVRLVDTYLHEKVVWANLYMSDSADFSAIQRETLLDITVSLEVQLTEGEQARISKGEGTSHLEAWVAASQGVKYIRRFTQEDNLRARAYYTEAARLDPEYAAAWEGVGWSHFVDARFGWSSSPQTSLELAAEYVERSLAIDPDRGRAFALLAGIALVRGDYDGAVELGEEAVLKGPSDADSMALLAYTLTYTGEPQRALGLIDRAIELRPTPPRWYYWLRARALRLQGRTTEAVALLEAEQRRGDLPVVAVVELILAEAAAGRRNLASRLGEELQRAYPGFGIRDWLAVPRYVDPDDQHRDGALLAVAGLPD